MRKVVRGFLPETWRWGRRWHDSLFPQRRYTGFPQLCRANRQHQTYRDEFASHHVCPGPCNSTYAIHRVAHRCSTIRFGVHPTDRVCRHSVVGTGSRRTVGGADVITIPTSTPIFLIFAAHPSDSFHSKSWKVCSVKK